MTIKKAVVTGLLVVSSLSFAGEQWGVKELKVASDSALEKFKTDQGEEIFAAITGFGVDKNVQGNAGKARVTYKSGDTKKVVSYFCHYHDADEIDCH